MKKPKLENITRMLNTVFLFLMLLVLAYWWADFQASEYWVTKVERVTNNIYMTSWGTVKIENREGFHGD